MPCIAAISDSLAEAMSERSLSPLLNSILALERPTPRKATRADSSSLTPYLMRTIRGLTTLLASGLKIRAISFME